MEIELHTYRIKGFKPLLQNNPAETLKPRTAEDDGVKPGRKKIYVPEEEARIRLYLTDDGAPCHPALSLRSALLAASPGLKVGSLTARTAFSASVTPAEEEIRLLHPQRWKPLRAELGGNYGYRIDARRAVVNRAGVIRHRPKWLLWGAYIVLEVDHEFMPSLENVTKMLNRAGRIVGLGDGRPDTSKGKSGVLGMGKFTAELWDGKKIP